MNITIDDLLKLVKTYNENEIEIVRSAYAYAENLHSGQVRQSGDIIELPKASTPLSYGPREDWIDKAHTTLAKRKIKEFKHSKEYRL